MRHMGGSCRRRPRGRGGGTQEGGLASAGQGKCEWAQEIAPHMTPGRNLLPSFQAFRDGQRSTSQPTRVPRPNMSIYCLHINMLE